LSTYAPIKRRVWPGSHPSLGALLGLVVLALLVPYTLEFGLMGFGLALFLAGLAAGALARGGPRTGMGAAARAAGVFMLLLLISWALLLLMDQGLVDLTSAPEVAEFVPYFLMMEGLWERISTMLDPVLRVLVDMAGGDLLVDLLLKVLAPAIPAAIGGSISGAMAGRPEPRPLPVAVTAQQAPYPPQMYAGMVERAPPELAYLCPWCGLRVLPHMVKCWNCGGPLQIPPPPTY
jgi:hypothetical protein